MEVWKDVELYEQGLERFESLTPLQRDWFTVKNLDIYCEMEGGFEDYLLSGGNVVQLAWLESTLRRLGDMVSLALITKLRLMNELHRQEMSPLCRAYYERRKQRWELLEWCLEQHGVEVDESP